MHSKQGDPGKTQVKLLQNPGNIPVKPSKTCMSPH